MPDIRARHGDAVRERRAHDRTNVALHGRLFVKGRHPSHCTVIDISPGGACVSTAVIPAVGEKVIMDVACTGRVQGVVVRSDPFDFGMQFTVCDDAKERLANQIAIQFNRARLGYTDRRGAEREECQGSDPVEFENGEIEVARIRDVSITGVSFISDRRPHLGQKVRVGVMTGKVVRHIDNGYAVMFDPPSTPV